ncbi:MAG: hypothetical protein NXI24_12750 [bacterium]|nr:hypothetical protein [bacterium]
MNRAANRIDPSQRLRSACAGALLLAFIATPAVLNAQEASATVPGFAVSEDHSAGLELGGFTSLNDPDPPGFGAGRFLIELRGAVGLSFGGEIYQNFRDQNRTFPIGPATLLSGNASAIALSFLSRQSAPEAKLKSIGGSLAVEYAIWDWFGIGLDLGQTSLDVEDARVISAGTELSLASIARLTGGSASLNGELVYPFLVQSFRDYDRISRADLTVGLHPFGGDGIIDPYLKLIGGYGRTKADGFQVLRYGGALGVRFFVTDIIYVVSEVAGINNEISGEINSSVGFFESSSEFEGNLREVNGLLGVGLAF